MRLTLFFQTQNGKARDYFCERIVFPIYFVEQSIPLEVSLSWHGTAQFHMGNIDIRLSMLKSREETEEKWHFRNPHS